MKKIVLAALLAIVAMTATRSVVAQTTNQATITQWDCMIQSYVLSPPIGEKKDGVLHVQKPSGEIAYYYTISWLYEAGCTVDGQMQVCDVYATILGYEGKAQDTGNWYVYPDSTLGENYTIKNWGEHYMDCGESSPQLFTAFLPVIQQPAPTWEVGD